METRILFSGQLRIEPAPPVKNDCQPCAVCGRGIVFDGIHIFGEAMNPEVREQRVARWRLGTETWFEGDSELARKRIPETEPIDVFVHDILCLAMFLRDRLNFPVLMM